MRAGPGLVQEIVQEVGQALRALRRSAGFTAIVIVTLALATGATTSIFSILHSVLLRPLPFHEPDRLVGVFGRVWADDQGRAGPDPVTAPVGSRELEAYVEQSRALAGLGGYSLTTTHLARGDGVERLPAVWADLTLFSVLGVGAVAGRMFDTTDPTDVVVISERLWRRRFDGDASMPGRVIILDGKPYTVVGVAPAAFQFPYSAASLMPGALPEARTELWIPLPPLRTGPGGGLRPGRVSVVARLAPGVTLESAQEELRLIARRVQDAAGDPALRVDARLAPLLDGVVGPARPSLWLLFASAGLVLAAACANVALLMLTRMMLRTREVITRAALGAGRIRLARQFLIESLLLAAAGGALGAALARAGTTVLVTLGEARIPRAHEVALDWPVFAFLLGCVVVVALLFGLAPAMVAAGLDARGALSPAGARLTAGRTHTRLRDALVVGEVALAFALGAAALLVIREAARLRNIDTGIDATDVITLHLTPRAPAADYMEIERRVAVLPGVRHAGFIQLLPLQNWGWDAGFEIHGGDPAQRPVAGLRYVTPGYFAALGIPVVRGRGLSPSDHADAQRVILINEALATRYFADRDPVGAETSRGTIAGVVSDVRSTSPGQPPAPELYYPVLQNVTMAADLGMTLVVRAEGQPEALLAALRSVVSGVNADLAVSNVRTMERVLDDVLWQQRLQQWLISLFSALTLMVAAIGLYGIAAYSVQARGREFAVRLALGSDTLRIARLVLVRALRLAAAGLTIGLLATLILTPALRLGSPGIRVEGSAFLTVAAVLLGIALLSCAIPASRVAAVDPAAALRHD